MYCTKNKQKTMETEQSYNEMRKDIESKIIQLRAKKRLSIFEKMMLNAYQIMLIEMINDKSKMISNVIQLRN